MKTSIFTACGQYHHMVFLVKVSAYNNEHSYLMNSLKIGQSELGGVYIRNDLHLVFLQSLLLRDFKSVLEFVHKTPHDFVGCPVT